MGLPPFLPYLLRSSEIFAAWRLSGRSQRLRDGIIGRGKRPLASSPPPSIVECDCFLAVDVLGMEQFWDVGMF